MAALEKRKSKLETQIKSNLSDYFSIAERLIDSQGYTTVIPSSTIRFGHYQPVFLLNGDVIDIPAVPGVYLVYKMNGEEPFYCGQTGDLKYRITFHFKDAESYRNASTLKKEFPQHERDLNSMSKNLKLRFLTIPYGKCEVEKFFHAKYGINTHRSRT